MFRRKKQLPPQTAEYLVVGLGNPGAQYERTRHNCGFMSLDLLAQQLGIAHISQIRCKALTALCEIAGHRVLLCKPQTYMSVLEEAPLGRQPVQTYVLEQDDGVLRDAIRRELARGGQVYYLHNRIESIDQTAGKLQLAFPDARIAVAHGRMMKATRAI